MSPAKYPRRLIQAANSLEILSLYSRGLAIADLAEQLNTSAHELRGTLDAYHRGREVTQAVGASPLVFFDTEPPESWNGINRDDWVDEHVTDADAAVWVQREFRRADDDPFAVMLSVRHIVDLLACAESLYETEPDNDELRTAIAALRLQWFPQMLETQASPDADVLPLLRQAIDERHKVRFVYCREWQPGVVPRIVEPWQLCRTHLGFELDAGPVRDNGRIRIYLVRNISDAELLDETFEPPSDAARLIAANRDTVDVEVVVPNRAARDYEGLVQNLEVLEREEEPEGDQALRIRLQQPFEDRLALFLFRAGPDAFVVEPDRFAGVAARKAAELLAHHGLA